MKVGELSLPVLRRALAGDGLRLECGPFRLRLRVPLPSLVAPLHALYADYPLAFLPGIDDFRVTLAPPRWWRRWLRPVARLSADGPAPYTDVPVAQALATLEWGINWCIATRAHHLLLLHAAVVARGGRALILPAWPGHGKSTLCAALAHAGWRLFSDEFGLVVPETGQLLPLPRPIGLKNAAIEVVRAFAPQAFMGPLCVGTHKGTVAHVRPPGDSIARAAEPAAPGWLVFPRWQADAPLALTPMPPGEAFVMLATNAFNYEVLGEIGFTLATRLARDCPAYTLRYSALADAIAALDELTRS